MASYPSKDEITKMFSHLATGDAPSFFSNVDANVDWTVMGTHPLAGNYQSLADFQQATFSRLGKIMKPPGVALGVRNVIGGGEQEWATVELVINAVCHNEFVFDNCYAWCCRFDKSGKIVQVRAYLDSWMVRQALVENEGEDLKNNRATVPRLNEL